jgi:hypothetical protein
VPYILHKDRIQCDKVVSGVVELCDKIDWDVGALNYIFSRILYAWFIRRRGYKTLNAIDGLLGCVSKEFYRKVTVPYEKEKEFENGDVYLLF